jgi:hypothetical protein
MKHYLPLLESINRKAKKIALMGASSGLLLAGGLSAAPLVSAEDCVRANPTTTLNTPADQTGDAGSTLTYNFTYTNNDSLGCLASTVDFFNLHLPSGWSVAPGSLVEYAVAPQTSVTLGYAYTSAANATNGTYSLVVDSIKYYPSPDNDDIYVLPVNLSYTVVNGQDPSTPPPPPPDTLAPHVQINSPVDNSTVRRGTTVSITADVWDSGGLATVAFKVDGVTLCSGDASLNTCTWNVPTQPSYKGAHLIEVVGTDVSGNVGTASITVTVK